MYCDRPCLFVCVFVCGSALLQPARSVCVASERFFIAVVIVINDRPIIFWHGHQRAIVA